MKHRLARRMADLLDLPVAADDGFSKYICDKCKRKVERLENAAEELEAFRRMANSTYTVLANRSDLKRTKETSSSVVSPDTARVRPPAKKQLTRRHLSFDQGKLLYLLYIDVSIYMTV